VQGVSIHSDIFTEPFPRAPYRGRALYLPPLFYFPIAVAVDLNCRPIKAIICYLICASELGVHYCTLPADGRLYPLPGCEK